MKKLENIDFTAAKDYFAINGTLLFVFAFIPFVINMLINYAFSFSWLFYSYAILGFFLFKVFLKPTKLELNNGVFYNWDHSQKCTPFKVHYPETEESVAYLVSRCFKERRFIKVIGNGYSYSPIGITNVHDGEMMSLNNLNRILSIDADASTVTAQAGVTIKELNEFLWIRGLSLSASGGVSDQTISGAMQTGSHDGSLNHSTFSSTIVSFKIVNGEGRIIRVTEYTDKDLFDAARVGLGSLGIVVEMTIQCEPAFYLQRKTEGCISIDSFISDLDSYTAHPYHSFWWDPIKNQFTSFVFDKVTRPSRVSSNIVTPYLEVVLAEISKIAYIGARLPIVNLFLMSMLFESMKSKKVIIDKSYILLNYSQEVLDHCPRFRQYEITIAKDKLEEFLNEVRDSIVKKGGFSFNVPISMVVSKKDSMWLSPNFNRDTVSINFSMVYNDHEFHKFIDEISDLALRFEGRPHWAKKHNMKAVDFEKVYPNFEVFSQLRQKMDPNGIFLNSYLKECFYKE